MSSRKSLLALIFLFVIPAFVAKATETLNSPDSSTLLLLQYKFSHATPPYESLAQWDNAVRSADEFHKQAALDQAVARLKAKFASLDGVKRITVNLMSEFSEYDPQRHEYDLDINDGTYIESSQVMGREIRVALDNGSKAQIWSLDPKSAEQVLARNKGVRWVTLALNLSLRDSTPATGEDPLILDSTVDSYVVLSRFGNVKLGNVSVEHDP